MSYFYQVRVTATLKINMSTFVAARLFSLKVAEWPSQVNSYSSQELPSFLSQASTLGLT